MTREIGSEFWDIEVCDNICFPLKDATRWFISGSSALEYILDDIFSYSSPASVALPSWCCECMITPFVKRGLKVYFYDVLPDNVNGGLLVDYSTIPACDIFYRMSYFGYAILHKKGLESGIIIEDKTHSVFAKDQSVPVADYEFGSLRKWTGTIASGFAKKRQEWNLSWEPKAKTAEYEEIRKTAMRGKLSYILGENDDKEYLKDFSEAEEYLDNIRIEPATEEDIDKAKKIDVNLIVNRRQSNARRLLSSDKVSACAIFRTVEDTECPLFVPILLPNKQRDNLRKILIDNNIYCPIHWPLSEKHNLTPEQERLYCEELSLVCDQRYGDEDMDRIIRIVESLDK